MPMKAFSDRMKLYHGFPSRQTLRAALRERAFLYLREKFPIEHRSNNKRSSRKMASREYREMMGLPALDAA